MKITQLSIQNLNSLRIQQTIRFSEPPLSHTGLFAITGDTGAGKTTILDAITLALYGRVPRHKNEKEVMSYEATESLAEVEFEHGGHLYRARWTIWKARGKTDGNILGPKRELAQYDPKSGEWPIIAEKVKDTNTAIEEITGLDYDRFRRSVLLAQGDFAAFLEAGEGERSELLERITGTEVYTEISKAAFQRFKIEEKILDEYKKELNNLKILLPEDLSSLHADKKALETEVKALGKNLKRIQQDQQLIQRVEVLQQQQTRLEQEAFELQGTLAANQSEFEQLALQEKVQPLLPDFRLLEVTRSGLNHLQHKLHAERKQQSLFKSRIEELSTTVDQHQQTLLDQKKEFARKQTLWEEVIAIDSLLSEWQTRILELQKVQEQQHLHIQSFKEQQETQEKQYQATQQQYSQTQEWLQEHRHLQSLPTEYSGLRRLIGNLLDQKRQVENIQKQLTAANSQLQQKAETLERLKKQAEQLEKDTSRLQTSFTQLAPEQFTQSRSLLLDRLQESIQELRTRQDNIDRAGKLALEYEQCLLQVHKKEEQIEQYRAEEHQLNNAILNSWDLTDELKQEVDVRQKIYERELKIANYEKDRSRLQPGDQCPLCLSTDHPFRKHGVQAFTDQARIDLEKVRKTLEEHEQKNRTLLNRQSNIYNSIRTIEQELQNLEQQLGYFEEQMATLQPRLFLSETARSHSSAFFLEESKQNQVELKRETDRRKQLQQVHQTLESKEQQLQQVRHQLVQNTAELNGLEREVQKGENQLEEIQQALALSMQEAQQQFNVYKIQLEENTIEAQLQQLQVLESNYRNQFSNEQTQSKQLLQFEQQLSQLKDRLQNSQKIYEETQQQLHQQQLQLDDLQKERSEKLADQDPREARRQMEIQLETLEVQLKQALDQKEEFDRQLADCQTRIAEWEQQEKETNLKQTELEGLLHQQFQKLGIEEWESLIPTLPSEAEVERIRSLQKELQASVTRIKSLQKQNEQELNQLVPKLATIPDRESLLKQEQTLDQQFQKGMQQIGRLEEKLQQDAQRRAQATQLMEQIEQQNKIFKRWARLNEVIGMADGKKFRLFAQGLTLDKLCQLANYHLRQLNGRYLIEKTAGQDLELEIIDTYQADNRRSVNTLSGGETFLLSLALALGLSDLAGRNTRIQSLFIDEGFGTLDDQSLDLAISTLENLQSSGKTIGIISHVKELKERIGIRIQVNKQSDGFSQIELIG